MVGLRQDLQYFFTLMLIAVLTALNGMAMGTLAASVFKTVEVALVILPLLLIPMMIFSGLMINNKTIPVYFKWIRYVSPTQYAYTAAMKNEYTGDLVVGKSMAGTSITGNQLLKEMAMDEDLDVWGNVIALLISYIVLLSASFVALYFISRRKK
jgi:ATP-binding cassette subfamily G (WHITE) protein 1